MVQIFEEFKEYIITGLISLLTAVAGWWAGKRKTTAETEVVETDVIKSIRELYGGLVEDVKATIEELRQAKTQIGLLSKEIDKLRNTVYVLEQDLEDCRNGVPIGNKK